MNIFYTKTSMWENDFFKNDIFKKDLYNNIKINFILFDNNTEIINNNEYNIIVTNAAIALSFLENMIKNLRPFIIFHLSDEWGKDIKYYNLYSRYNNIKILFNQYNFEKLDYKINNFQIPLGYVSGFLLNKSYINCKQKEYNKKYDFSFIGTVKSDRNNMLNKFSNNFRNNFIHTGSTCWSNPEKQNIKPHQMFNIYKDSLFVPVGRGNRSLDCFRLYEAIVAGAIPVICAPIEEINVTFQFNNEKPYIITADTWDKAVLLCKELYSDKDKICNIINSNNKWFQEKIINISKKINELL
tara:strand:- start:88 stop:981 length:894 start_codon:yes stop_codon:yes gene_type:complete